MSQLAALDRLTAHRGAPLIDWARLNELRDLQQPGEPDVLKEIIDTFVDDSAVRLLRLTDALRRGDTEMVRLEAHTLKGSADVLFAEPLRVAAEALEREAARGRSESLAPLVESLTAALADARLALTRRPDAI